MSGGRAEVILGRGSFTESFPLFGYSLDDYEVLFEEKLAIFAALRDAGLYHRALAQLGSPPLPVGVHSPGHVADTDAGARDELWPAYEVMRNRIGAERGWNRTSRAEFDREIAPGSLYVGSPETVARKIAATVSDLGASRFDLKYSNGTLPHEPMTRSIELYGREVIPRVRRLLAPSAATAPSASP